MEYKAKELKPCPFCGGKNIQEGTIENKAGTSRKGVKMYQVFCNNCYANVDSFDRQESIKLWNARHNEAEYGSLQEASKWQLIDTAPKDSEAILLVEKSGFTCVGWWSYDLGKWVTGFTKNATISGLFLQSTASLHEVTHWQPLPKQPK